MEDFATVVLRGQALADHGEWPQPWLSAAQQILATPWEDPYPLVPEACASIWTGPDRGYVRVPLPSGWLVTGEIDNSSAE